MSVTITLHAWWLLAYLVVGAVLYLPLCWIAYRQLHNPRKTFWQHMRWTYSVNPWFAPLVSVAAWPIAVWEAVS